jgi:hypothetical protein
MPTGEDTQVEHDKSGYCFLFRATHCFLTLTDLTMDNLRSVLTNLTQPHERVRANVMLIADWKTIDVLLQELN